MNKMWNEVHKLKSKNIYQRLLGLDGDQFFLGLLHAERLICLCKIKIERIFDAFWLGFILSICM
jgi:hypothetical protein